MPRDIEIDEMLRRDPGMELLRDARAADRVDKERAELFAAMVKTRAWQEYVALLEAQLQAHSDRLLGPAGSVDGMVALEYVKGAMSGLVIARDLPSVTIAAMDQLRRERRGATSQPADDEDDE